MKILRCIHQDGAWRLGRAKEDELALISERTALVVRRHIAGSLLNLQRVRGNGVLILRRNGDYLQSRWPRDWGVHWISDYEISNANGQGYSRSNRQRLQKTPAPG